MFFHRFGSNPCTVLHKVYL